MRLRTWVATLRRRAFLTRFVAAAAIVASGCSTPSSKAARREHAAVRPVPREDAAWRQRYEGFVARAGAGDAGIVFLGDSITEGWETEGRAVWEARYAPRKGVNFGISGDRTQHLLWRIENGNLDAFAAPPGADPAGSATPKLAVVMIGTNNSGGDEHSAAEIADGIVAVVEATARMLPDAKILLLAIFPRGEAPNPQRAKCAAASLLASRVADGKRVHYLDVGRAFLGPDGTISREVMSDFLHLSPKGYEIWSEAIESKVRELLGEP